MFKTHLTLNVPPTKDIVIIRNIISSVVPVKIAQPSTGAVFKRAASLLLLALISTTVKAILKLAPNLAPTINVSQHSDVPRTTWPCLHLTHGDVDDQGYKIGGQHAESYWCVSTLHLARLMLLVSHS